MDEPTSEAEDAKTYFQRLQDLWSHHQFRKLLRYSAVSLCFVPLGQLGVQYLHAKGMNEVWSVWITACVLTPPNFVVSKYYVWRHKRKDNMATEIMVFWVSALLGTALASGTVWVAAQFFKEQNGLLAHRIAIFIAQLVGYGVVWVARFIFLDRLIFKVTHHGEDQPVDDSAELPGTAPSS